VETRLATGDKSTIDELEKERQHESDLLNEALTRRHLDELRQLINKLGEGWCQGHWDILEERYGLTWYCLDNDPEGAEFEQLQEAAVEAHDDWKSMQRERDRLLAQYRFHLSASHFSQPGLQASDVNEIADRVLGEVYAQQRKEKADQEAELRKWEPVKLATDRHGRELVLNVRVGDRIRKSFHEEAETYRGVTGAGFSTDRFTHTSLDGWRVRKEAS
jgi:hypothetical protein